MNTYQEHKREASILKRASAHEIMDIAVKHGGFIAGGAVRSVFASERINDYDIFFPSKKDFDNCTKEFAELTNDEGGFKYKFTRTDSAWSYRTESKQQFQLIQAVFGTPDQIVDSFDFTVCMAAWIPMDNRFLLNDLFLKHLSQRRLHFNANAGYPICSLWRAFKYTQRGYKLPAIDAIKIALKIHSLKLTDRGSLKKQLMGIDTVFLAELTKALEEGSEAAYDFGEAIEMIETFIDEKETDTE